MIVRSSVFVLRAQRFSRFCLRYKSTRRTNPLGIQMLSSSLHKQLFSSVGEPNYSRENIEKAKAHLRQFDFGAGESEVLDDIEFQLPPLENSDLNRHFEIIAREQSKPYVRLIHQLIRSKVPPKPKQWTYRKGWTKFVLSSR